eukprot:CAMPEP_0194265356 /NCGR_PEP_ID=MMETSP0169-20130528/625_1 /TAXON_ID=218684 /ORGANISM="Corethron pennatum, Strain L29A3" /LENGTH=337 /DNA_ID=CAMNT_0039005801 /DNA_START=308 /DNA_END=1321 /DNA_ORIENTATION=+
MNSDDILIREDMTGDEDGMHAFLLGRTMSRAIYGKVKMAFELRKHRNGWLMTGKKHAIKIMNWERIRNMRDQNHHENPIKEVSCMQFLSNANYQAEVGRENVLPLNYIYTDDVSMFLIMPFADGGELFSHIEERGEFPENEARYWFRQILNGLSFLQRHGVCHRDMSLENLIIDGNRTLIMDFGMCLRVPYSGVGDGFADVTTGTLRRIMTRQGTCGKPNYMAPEILRNTEFDGFAIDLWGVGVILFMMLTGTEPWQIPDDRVGGFNYIANQGRLQEVLDRWDIVLSVEAIDLLSNMLTADPRRRFTLQQVFEHEWVRNEAVAPQMDEEEPFWDQFE